MAYVIIAVIALAFLCTVVRSVRRANRELALILNQEGAKGMGLNSRLGDALTLAGELGADVLRKAEALAEPCRKEIDTAANALVSPHLSLQDKYELVSRHHDQAAWRLETLEWHVQQALEKRMRELPPVVHEPEPREVRAVLEAEPAEEPAVRSREANAPVAPPERQVLEVEGGEQIIVEFGDSPEKKEGV